MAAYFKTVLFVAMALFVVVHGRYLRRGQGAAPGPKPSGQKSQIPLAREVELLNLLLKTFKQRGYEGDVEDHPDVNRCVTLFHNEGRDKAFADDTCKELAYMAAEEVIEDMPEDDRKGFKRFCNSVGPVKRQVAPEETVEQMIIGLACELMNKDSGAESDAYAYAEMLLGQLSEDDKKAYFESMCQSGGPVDKSMEDEGARAVCELIIAEVAQKSLEGMSPAEQYELGTRCMKSQFAPGGISLDGAPVDQIKDQYACYYMAQTEGFEEEELLCNLQQKLDAGCLGSLFEQIGVDLEDSRYNDGYCAEVLAFDAMYNKDDDDEKEEDRRAKPSQAKSRLAALRRGLKKLSSK